MAISKPLLDCLGVDANGRSFRWARSIQGSMESMPADCKYSLVGVAPEYQNEKFIWDNELAARSSMKPKFISLEEAWASLSQDADPFKWVQADGKGICWPGDAIGEAIRQNLPSDVSSALAIAIPNHLEESDQDTLLRGIRNAGLSHAKLIWRPIALAIYWLTKNASLVNGFKGKLPKLWVIDLESRGLEATSFELREKNGSIIPVRKCPEDKCDSWMSYKNVMSLTTHAANGNPDYGRQLLWGGYGAELQRSLEYAKLDCLFWLREDLRWRSVLLKNPTLEDVWRCDLDVNQETSGKLQSLTDCLLASLPREQVGETDIVLWHGWPARLRLFPKYAQGLYKANRQYVLEPDAAAIGAKIYLERLGKSMPTYLDTLPQYGIWAELKKQDKWDFYPLIPEDVEVDGGSEYQLPNKIEGLFIKKGSKQFPIILRRGRKDDCRSIDTELPEAPSADIKVQIGATMRPVSGFATVTIESPDGTPLFRRHTTIKLNWDTMIKVPPPIPPPKSLRVVYGYPLFKAGEGRILNSEEQFTKLKKLITEDIIPHGGINSKHVAYLNNEANKFYLPWGWTHVNPRVNNIGLFGPYKKNDKRILDIAEEFGKMLFVALNERREKFGLNDRNHQKLYRLLGFMYSYAPEVFIKHLAKCFQESRIYCQNQVIAAGRVFSQLMEFEIFVDSFINQAPYPKTYTQWYFWSFMRCLCYYEKTALLPLDKAVKIYQSLKNYLKEKMEHRVGGNATRYALCAVLFGLRIREHHPGFLAEDDPIRVELSSTISSMSPPFRFPPVMFRGINIKPKEGDNLNNYVIRFLNYKETAEDRKVAGGLAADG